MEKRVNKLPDEVGEKYKVPKGHPYRFVHAKFGEIDLNHTTLGQAERLIEAGVKHIIPIRKKKLS